MGYNSPYSKVILPKFDETRTWVDVDIQIKDGSVPYRQDKMKSLKDGRPICFTCFHGLHPHAPRMDGEILEDVQDCKVLLLDDDGKEAGQCCCTWTEGGKA